MASRIVPGSWSFNAGQVEIPDNMSNVENIEWLMLRYPLEVISGELWQTRVTDLAKQKEKRVQLRQLVDTPAVSGQFKGSLMDFQRKGVDFLLKTSGVALLADEMGLGKTVQSLAYLVSEEEAFPCLVVAPLVTLTNWMREIMRFIEKDSKKPYSIQIIRDGKESTLDYTDFVIINYDLLAKRRDDIERLGPRTIIADECQNLRNYNSQKTMAIKEISNTPTVRHRIGLSGTPCYNHGTEIWSITDFIFPGLLGTWNEFSREFISSYDGRTVLEAKRAGLYEILNDNIMLRRRKIDVLQDLPPKVRYKQQVAIDENYYKTEMAKHLAKLESTLAEPGTKTDFRAANRAYQAFTENERIVAGVAKIPYVTEFVREMMENEEPVVVFCHHLAVHELLKDHLANFSPVGIIGGQTDNQRQNAIDLFQKGHTKLMIAGIRAGSLGISLTAARYVIFAELDWSPAVHRQAEDRLHRIGQKDTVFAYYLEGKDTYDEHVSDILVDKKVEIDELLGDAKKSDDFVEAGILNERVKGVIEIMGERFEKILPLPTAVKPPPPGAEIAGVHDEREVDTSLSWYERHPEARKK